MKALHVVELKEAIGEVLGRFELAGLAADDIDEALELVEEVETEAAEEAFWRPYVDRILGAVEVYDDGRGPLRTGIAGLENLRLEPWELKAARRTVAARRRAADGAGPDPAPGRGAAAEGRGGDGDAARRRGAHALVRDPPVGAGDARPRADARRRAVGGDRRGRSRVVLRGDPLLDPDAFPAPAGHFGALADAGFAPEPTAAIRVRRAVVVRAVCRSGPCVYSRG